MATTSKCVRGREYAVRVDLKKTDLTLGPELARGGSSVVYRGVLDGQAVAVKKPHLPSKRAPGRPRPCHAMPPKPPAPTRAARAAPPAPERTWTGTTKSSPS